MARIDYDKKLTLFPDGKILRLEKLEKPEFENQKCPENKGHEKPMYNWNGLCEPYTLQ